MAGGGGGSDRELDQTPTWAVAGVCFTIIVISIALEKIIHLVGHVRNNQYVAVTAYVDFTYMHAWLFTFVYAGLFSGFNVEKKLVCLKLLR